MKFICDSCWCVFTQQELDRELPAGVNACTVCGSIGTSVPMEDEELEALGF